MLRKIRDTSGFTLIEMMIALVIGLVVLGGATSFAITTLRTVEANQIREGVYRNARFVAMSLERDFQGTGVGMASTITFGSLATWSDTIVVLGVNYQPALSPPYALPAGFANPMPPGGTCGARCIDLQKDANGQYDLAVGDLARLEVPGVRRLILIESVVDMGANFRIGFTAATELLYYTAGLTGGLLLDASATFVQKLAPVVYWVENNDLMRAERLNMDGTLDGSVLAYGIETWDASLIFVDGDEAVQADPYDVDLTNDFDDLLGVRIQAVLSADRVHPTVNRGQLYKRSYEWRFSPRNLMYERNRF